jgi:FAD-dependent oxidoreductase domain-containing protein 1
MAAEREKHGVVIAGGAIVGAMTAFFLREEGYDGSITIVERFTGSSRKTTGFYLGGLKQQYSSTINIRLSQFALQFYRDFERRFGVSAGLLEHGYLMLYTPETEPMLRENLAVQHSEGVDVIVEDAGALSQRYPWLNLDGIAAGSIGLSGEGSFEAWRVLSVIRRMNREAGVNEFRDEIVDVLTSGDRVRGVRLDSGRQIDCDILINAADPNSARISALAGVDLPVEPRKRQMFRFSRPAQISDIPMIIDITGVYIRPDRRAWSCGKVAEPFDEAVALEGDLTPDTWRFADILLPIIARRIPACNSSRLGRAWTIHYDYNTFDQNAIIGPHDTIDNLLFVCGLSGRALGHAPAVARAVAELAVHGCYRTVDCTVLGYERIAAGLPVEERNVV